MTDPGPSLTDPPLLAVVVLSVGAAPELARAVRSIQAQGVPVELTIVNSGGGDVAARLPNGGEGIGIVSFEQVLWPGAARNRGIAATRAPFVAFLASDCTAQPGWVAGRLREHLKGAPAVASAIVNDRPNDVVSSVYHVTHVSTRDPNQPAARASRYGASYARWMFDRYGPFREDLRVAEDSEFHARLAPEHRPVWAPQVRTVHANPVRLWPALRHHFERGRNAGQNWLERPRNGFVKRVTKLSDARWRDFRRLVPHPHSAGEITLQLMIKALVFANQLGRSLGRRQASPFARAEGRAREDARAKRWRRSAERWGEAAMLTSDPQGPLRHQATSLARAGDHEDAVAIHRRLLALYPDLCWAVVGCAHALLEHSVLDGRDLLNAALPRFGRRFAILDALAAAELALGDNAAAERIFKEMAETFPESSRGERGLVGLALARQDWSLAARILRSLGLDRGDPGALAEAIELSTYLGDRKEAEALINALQATDAVGDLYLHERIVALGAVSDTAGLAALLRENRTRIIDAPPLLAAMVEALNVASQSDQALELLKDAIARGHGSHRNHLLSTYLSLGQTDTALQLFAETSDVASLTTSTFTALVAAASDSDKSLATDLAERAATPRNGNWLRFAALFQSARLESLAALEANPPRLAQGQPIERRLSQLLATLSPDSATRNDVLILEACCRSLSSLRESRAEVAPDPNFVVADAIRVGSAIASAVREARPFSLVRLGDGEGNLLPYRPSFKGFQETDYAATQRVWWGDGHATGGDLEALLRAAIDGANVVGLPDLFRLSCVSTFSGLQGVSPRSRNLRGLIAAFDYGCNIEGPLLTSCHIHQALGHWALWDILLPQVGVVSLITCHEALGPALVRQHGLSIAATHIIPPEFKHASKFGASVPMGRHYPDVFESLREPLSRVPRGHVVLVAAGVLGKIYCDWIKTAGGIAIDVGSAADHWRGYTTRPAHETLAYQTPRGVRARIEALAKSDPLVASIVHLRG